MAILLIYTKPYNSKALTLFSSMTTSSGLPETKGMQCRQSHATPTETNSTHLYTYTKTRPQPFKLALYTLFN